MQAASHPAKLQGTRWTWLRLAVTSVTVSKPYGANVITFFELIRASAIPAWTFAYERLQIWCISARMEAKERGAPAKFLADLLPINAAF